MEQRKIYNRELMTGSLILGVALVAVMVLQYLIRNMEGSFLAALLSLAGFVVIVVAQLRYGRRVAALSSLADGFSLGKAFGFMLMLSASAGVIYGLGAYIMQEVVDPAYYYDLQNKMVQVYVKSLGMTPEQASAFDSAEVRKMMSQIWIVVFSGIFGMVFQGGLIALFTSAMVRRKPQISTNQE